MGSIQGVPIGDGGRFLFGEPRPNPVCPFDGARASASGRSIGRFTCGPLFALNARLMGPANSHTALPSRRSQPTPRLSTPTARRSTVTPALPRIAALVGDDDRGLLADVNRYEE